MQVDNVTNLTSNLLKPIYKNEIALNGNPTQANAAFSAVFAAAIANGGSTRQAGA